MSPLPRRHQHGEQPLGGAIELLSPPVYDAHRPRQSGGIQFHRHQASPFDLRLPRSCLRSSVTPPPGPDGGRFVRRSSEFLYGIPIRLTRVRLQPTICLDVSTFLGFDWPCSLVPWAWRWILSRRSLLTRKLLDVEGKGYRYAVFAFFPPSSRTAETFCLGKTRFPTAAPGNGDVGPVNHRRRSWNGH